MKRFFVLLTVVLLLIPVTLFAADPTIEDLQKQIAEIMEELDDLNDRVNVPERHAALDRISFYGDLRTKADALHYQDVTFNPGILVNYDDFFAKTGAGEFGAVDLAALQPLLGEYYQVLLGNMAPTDMSGDPTATYDADSAFAGFMNTMLAMPAEQQKKVLAAMFAGGVGAYSMMAAPKTSDINNDVLYTTRLRLGMKAKISSNMDFAGRLLMYKNWGDSVGSKVFDSWDAFAMDGTNGGKTSGDWLRVERAYFNWKDIGGSNFYLSIGRRPSTYGPPNQFRENEMRGGTPTGHLVHFNFDGITAGYKLSELTGIEGQTVRFCYGQGFESEWGNGTLFNDDITANLEDTHLGGFNIDVYNDGRTFVQATLFRAQDVVDGFKGVIAFPTQYAQLFAPTLYSDMQKFKTFNFETRYTPTTVIGNINLAALGFTREEDNGFTWFGSLAWTQLESNGKAGMFGGMGSDAVYEATLSEDGSEIYMTPARAENDDNQDGYGVYVGIQIPAPMGKFGLEYNYGSEYWTPFTQAQDDMLGSKLATRGHAAEAYYIFEVNSNASIKVGGIYYDYEYTGSGSPVGKPIKIEDIEEGSAYSLLPVVDTAWNAYAQMSMKF